MNVSKNTGISTQSYARASDVTRNNAGLHLICHCPPEWMFTIRNGELPTKPRKVPADAPDPSRRRDARDHFGVTEMNLVMYRYPNCFRGGVSIVHVRMTPPGRAARAIV